MRIVDVNVLVHAFRREAPLHIEYGRWLASALDDAAGFGVPDLVLSGFLRVATLPALSLGEIDAAVALRFARELRGDPRCNAVNPGADHWRIFTRLCEAPGITGNHTADAYLAAIAIEADCEWVSADRGFARFPGLRWRHPLD